MARKNRTVADRQKSLQPAAPEAHFTLAGRGRSSRVNDNRIIYAADGLAKFRPSGSTSLRSLHHRMLRPRAVVE